MELNIDIKEIEEFTKEYFKSLEIKQLLLLGIVLFIIEYLYSNSLPTIINVGIIVSILALRYFLFPNLLYKEINDAILDFYNNDKSIGDSTVFICNLKKYLGPLFGALYIRKDEIRFIPFKRNLQDQSILIEKDEMNNIEISIVELKSSVIDKLLFKHLTKAVEISYKDTRMLVQTPRPECAIKEIALALKG